MPRQRIRALQIAVRFIDDHSRHHREAGAGLRREQRIDHIAVQFVEIGLQPDRAGLIETLGSLE